MSILDTTKSQKIDQCIFLNDFINFVKNRETVLSVKPNLDKIKYVYKYLITPTLSKGKYRKLRSDEDKEDFIGSVFALSIYAKKHRVDGWIYESKTNSGLKPDFLINKDYYVEAYCPALNHVDSNKKYYLKTDSEDQFTRRSLVDKIEEKSAKYKNERLAIVVSIIYSEFLNDLLSSLKSVELKSSRHKLFLYHGDKEFKK